MNTSMTEMLNAVYTNSTIADNPQRAGDMIRAEFPEEALVITPVTMLKDMLDAVACNEKGAFYEKYCLPALLIIAVKETNSVRKTALQHEMTVIVSARTVQRKKTLLISCEPLTGILNSTLRRFFYISACMINTYETEQEEKLQRYLRKLQKYAGYYEESELAELDENSLSLVRQEYKKEMDSLRRRVLALREEFFRSAHKEKDDPACGHDGKCAEHKPG